MATQTHAEVQVEHAPAGKHDAGGLFSPDVTMLLLTWVTFFLLLAVLSKFAWKPILDALQAREEYIRKAVDEADKVKAELAEIDRKRKQILDEATQAAKDMIEQSRKAAVEAAKTIQHKAREEAQIVLENARREINEEVERAKSLLKEESVNTAIALAGKIIEENLDDERNRKLIDEYIKNI